MGVGLGTAVELGCGVGEGGLPGQIEMLCSEGPGGEGTPQLPTGMPPGPVVQVELLEPLPQLHDKAPAISIIAVPISIQRAPPTIANQL